MSEPRFECKYCHHTFVIESRYMKHKCKQMKRMEDIQSPDGQAAFDMYQTWMKQMKRMPPKQETFMTSKYFATFLTFAKFAKKVHLPRPETFIWLMVQKQFQPSMWTNDDVYALYMEFLDRKIPPMDQFAHSLKIMLTIADRAEIDISEVLEFIGVMELIHLIRVRQISPWLLIPCSSFKKLFRETASDEQRIILEQLIRFDYWAEKFKEHPNELAAIKNYIADIGI